MEKDKRPTYFDQWMPLWNKWHQWLRDMDISALEACLRYTNSFPQVDRILVGVETKKQLMEIIQIMQGKTLQIPEEFSSNDLDLINPSNWISRI